MRNELVHLYVSLEGNDLASGGKDAPFATLHRAQAAARQARQAGAAVHVHVHGGVYYLAEPLRFLPEDSGSSIAPVVYEAVAGEEVILSGGMVLELQWQLDANGLFTSQPLPDVRQLDQLFVDGRPMHMARYPNYDEGIRIMNGYAKDSIEPERAKRWADPAGGYVHAMHSHLWGDYHYVIRGKDDEHQLQLEGGWQNNRQMGMHDSYRYVENVFEELDAPGEWYQDQQDGSLYVYPYADTDLSTACVEGVRLTHLIEFAGTELSPVRHIQIKGMTFRHARRTFMDNREPLLRSDWTTYRGGAVLLHGTEDCVLEDCTFRQLGGNAVFVDNYNRRTVIKGCHMTDVGANGVAFVGASDAVRSPLFEYHERQSIDAIDQTPGPQTNHYPADCLVEDCLIVRIGRVEKQSAPIQISMALDISIRYCSIYEVPRAGINICDGTFGGHVVEHCDIFDTVLETGDHGSFNSWGRDRYWLLEDMDMDGINPDSEAPDSSLPILDMVRPITLRYNRWRCDYGWDIDLDDGSSWYHIHHNLCLGGGIKLREGFYRTCENNIMVNNSFHPHVWFKGSRDIFQRNILFTDYVPIRVPKPWGKICDWNLLHKADAKAPTPAHSLQEQSGADRHSIIADAMFVDSDSGDYTVSDRSPALELGFVNFPMNQFGVRKSELRKLAKTPKMPAIGQRASESGRLPQHSQWDRCHIKNIVGMGEVSAAGLPAETGVILESMPWGSWQMEKGFQVADVILELNDRKVDTVDDLLDGFHALGSDPNCVVTIFRGQKAMTVTI